VTVDLGTSQNTNVILKATSQGGISKQLPITIDVQVDPNCAFKHLRPKFDIPQNAISEIVMYKWKELYPTSCKIDNYGLSTSNVTFSPVAGVN
jgi:hypothetical protein